MGCACEERGGRVRREGAGTWKVGMPVNGTLARSQAASSDISNKAGT